MDTTKSFGVINSLDMTRKLSHEFFLSASNSIVPPFVTETCIGNLPLWSPSPNEVGKTDLFQIVDALSASRQTCGRTKSAGKSNAARTANTTMTTNTSTNVIAAVF